MIRVAFEEDHSGLENALGRSTIKSREKKLKWNIVDKKGHG